MGADSSELQRACGKTAKSLWPGRFLPPPLEWLERPPGRGGVGWGLGWEGVPFLSGPRSIHGLGWQAELIRTPGSPQM